MLFINYYQISSLPDHEKVGAYPTAGMARDESLYILIFDNKLNSKNLYQASKHNAFYVKSKQVRPSKMIAIFKIKR